MASKYQSPVFIVGLPRSGTTLLQSLLCSTEQFFPIPETHFFSRAARGLPASGLSEENVSTIVKILREKAVLEFAAEDFAGCGAKREAFERVIDRFNSSGTSRFLEKTPRHIFFHDEIMNCYPSARFICLLREPRNHAASILNMGDKGKTMALLAMAYNRFVRTAHAIARGGHALIVTYEQLVDHPEETVRNLCTFIGIPYDEKMFASFNETARKVVGEHETWKHGVIASTSVERNDPEKWRRTLSSGEGDLMVFLTRRAAAGLGFPVEYRMTGVLSGLVQDLSKIWKPEEIRRFAAEFRGD